MKRAGQYKWVALALVGALVLLSLAGPAGRDRMDDYWRQWLVCTKSALLYVPGPSALAEVKHPSKESAIVRFDQKTEYGTLTLLHGPGAALLLDDSGEPVWAGTWALPLRFDGKIAALLLLHESMIPWHEIGMYRKSFLDFTTSPPTWEEEAGGHYMIVDGPTEAKGILDIDSDGTDEVVVVRADGPDPFSKQPNSPWELVVYEQVRTTRFPSRPGFVDGPDWDDDEPVGQKVLELRTALRVPIDIAAARVSWEVLEAGGGIRILDYSQVDVSKESSRPRVMGTITRDEASARWVFTPSE